MPMARQRHAVDALVGSTFLLLLLLVAAACCVGMVNAAADGVSHGAAMRRRRSIPPTFHVEFSHDLIPDALLAQHPLVISQQQTEAPPTSSDNEEPQMDGAAAGGHQRHSSTLAGLSAGREGWQRIRLQNGTQYMCYVPSMEDVALEEVQKRNMDDEGNRDGRRKRGAALSPSTGHALRNKMGDRCATKTQDWWTYEVCWEKNVRQYHVNQQQNAATIDKEYFLGKGPEMHVEDGTGYDLTYGEHPSYGPFVSTTFYNGTDCDLTETPRQTEVRLFCSDGAPQQAAESIQVSEPRTCQYLVLWWSARACIALLQREVGVHLPIRCFEQH